MNVIIDIKKQKLQLFDNKNLIKSYLVSTAKKGTGEENGSEKTPCGQHIIRAKIGAAAKPNTIFVARRPTGEIYKPELRVQFPDRDWILTRILWLSGLEVGKNRLNNVDTFRRFVYIHGSPDEVEMGKPGSRGCIRMRNKDIVELFDLVNIKDSVLIQE